MNGVIYAIKPPGMTSSNLVVALKRILNTKKVGHTGTLDPGACGVMGVCVGRATKISDYLMDGPKTYIAEIRFGRATDTLDSYGKIIEICDKKICIREMEVAILDFIGEIDQIPPMYSAIKVGGQKMYQLARQGREIVLPSRKIVIYSIDILEYSEAENAGLIKIVCSKGTYIRTLCSDIAAKLGTVCCMSFLIRTNACNASISDAYTLDEMREMAKNGDYGFILPMDSALSYFKKIELEEYLFPIVTTGSHIDLKRIKNGADVPQNENILVYCSNRFIGIGWAADDELKIKNMIYLEGMDYDFSFERG